MDVSRSGDVSEVHRSGRICVESGEDSVWQRLSMVENRIGSRLTPDSPTLFSV